MPNEFGFYELIWSFCIALLLFFAVVCFALYKLVGEKSFKYYSYYCLFLLIYLSFKNETPLDLVWDKLFNLNEPEPLLVNFNWYVQVVFYTFYSLFGIYFTDVDQLFHKLSSRIKTFLYWQLGFASVLFILATLLHNASWFYYFFLFWFVPYLLLQFVVLLPKILLTKGSLKRVFITGLSIYILGAILALYFSLNHDKYQMDAPLIFFLCSVLIESIFFGLGIAFKYKDIYEDREIKNKELATLAYNQEINVLRALMEGEQRERKRISTELHDNLGNLLATALLQFESVSRRNNEIEGNENYEKGMELLEKAAGEVRSIAHNMIPEAIYQHGLIYAIKEIAKNISSLEVSFKSEREHYHINEKYAVIIYRIVQEAFNNIIKHSKADKVNIRLYVKQGNFHLSIKDNGIGFREKEVAAGLGLKNQRSRAKLLGGEVVFSSIIGKGTKMHLTVPIENMEENE